MENLPSEMQWNITKFMRHPIADMYLIENSECLVDEDDEDEGDTFAFSWFRRKQLNDRIKFFSNMSDQHFLYPWKEQLIKNACDEYLRVFPG